MRLDFETYSEADLTAVGAYKYSVDPSTKIVLMHYELDGRHVSHDPELPLPNEVRRHIETGAASTHSTHSSNFAYGTTLAAETTAGRSCRSSRPETPWRLQPITRFPEVGDVR